MLVSLSITSWAAELVSVKAEDAVTTGMYAGYGDFGDFGCYILTAELC